MKLRFLALLVLIAGCSSTAPEPISMERMTADGEEITSTGESAYLEYCAGCHETGMLGAPVVGEPDSWSGRSTLWQAVLMEHAKEGYYDMPARGSRPDLSDEAVNAAVEYMLSVTFPNRPPDQ